MVLAYDHIFILQIGRWRINPCSKAVHISQGYWDVVICFPAKCFRYQSISSSIIFFINPLFKFGALLEEKSSSKGAYSCPLKTQYIYGNVFILKHLSVNTQHKMIAIPPKNGNLKFDIPFPFDSSYFSPRLPSFFFFFFCNFARWSASRKKQNKKWRIKKNPTKNSSNNNNNKNNETNDQTNKKIPGSQLIRGKLETNTYENSHQ